MDILELLQEYQCPYLLKPTPIDLDSGSETRKHKFLSQSKANKEFMPLKKRKEEKEEGAWSKSYFIQYREGYRN